ncbi:MAG: 50S ribosomal protein L23 [Candidatus Bipolaricaulota bacterium]|nr:50S ribosomal protein L23 [Candidatus Bipolaricaulota bacterium]MDW8030257.1 50S ribosomal protein L23 [Candidatus Bipolaricaulota bacterium]
MEFLEDILREPVISEKGWRLQEENKYVFEVHPKANKNQIKRAVESIFKVKVLKVWTLNMPGKPRTKKFYQQGEVPGWKKAIVQVAPGQRIEVYGKG